MSEDTKRNGIGAGAVVVKSSSDDRKSLSASSDDRQSSSNPATSTTVGKKTVIIKSADMKPDLQNEAVDVAIAAFEKCNVEKDVAEQIKKEFDKKYGPTWHCIVGKNFDASCNSQFRFNRSSKVVSDIQPKAGGGQPHVLHLII